MEEGRREEGGGKTPFVIPDSWMLNLLTEY
jgi:hypothetical protein